MSFLDDLLWFLLWKLSSIAKPKVNFRLLKNIIFEKILYNMDTTYIFLIVIINLYVYKYSSQILILFFEILISLINKERVKPPS